jgi:hypothetical protein
MPHLCRRQRKHWAWICLIWGEGLDALSPHSKPQLLPQILMSSTVETPCWGGHVTGEGWFIASKVLSIISEVLVTRQRTINKIIHIHILIKIPCGYFQVRHPIRFPYKPGGSFSQLFISPPDADVEGCHSSAILITAFPLTLHLESVDFFFFFMGLFQSHSLSQRSDPNQAQWQGRAVELRTGRLLVPLWS